jgi:Flp pilus assembly protein TadD
MSPARATVLVATAWLLVGQAAIAGASSVDALLDHAEALRAAKQPNQAASVASQALRRDPHNFRARYDMGLIQNDRGDTKGAIMNLTEAVQGLGSAPAPDATIYNALGWLYMSLGDVADAEHWYLVGYANKGQLSGPSLQLLLNNLGNLYLIKGDQATATRYFREAAGKGSVPAQMILPKLSKLPPQSKMVVRKY